MAVVPKDPSTKPQTAVAQQRAKQAPNQPTANTAALPRPSAVLQRAMADPSSLNAAEVDVLQRTIGLRAAQRMLDIPIQARLAVGPTGDKHEQEADRGAEQVVGDLAAPASDAVQRSVDQLSPAAQAAEVVDTIQRVMVRIPPGVKLTGGNGVTVLWKKSKKSDVPHVTVGHGRTNPKNNTVDITNVHYKYDHAGYYHWDESGGKTLFKLRGGEPTAGVYTQASKVAKKFGLTLEKPASIPDAPAPVAAQAGSGGGAQADWGAEVEEDDLVGVAPQSNEVQEASGSVPENTDVLEDTEAPDNWEDLLDK